MKSVSLAAMAAALVVTPLMAQDFDWSGRVPSDGMLEIKGISGRIEARPASGTEARVTAEMTARRSNPSSVRVEMIESGDGLTFCAVYPTPEGKRENYCASGSEGRMSTERNDVQVDFIVHVPAGVSFVARNVNGDVIAEGLASDVRVETVNGDVEIETTGAAEASTVNGSIEAAFGVSTLRSDVEFSTVNGGITLDVPDDFNAELDAEWLNGHLDSDLPLSLRGRMGRRSARGTLGDGGARLEVSTVNGSIRIR